MDIYLNRHGKGKKTEDLFTIGELIVNNIKVFTLEDDYDETKEYGKTRIPAGRYEIKFRKEGLYNQKYAKRFAAIHKGMLEVTNVPGYKYILIHCGNSHNDTHGCILVGLKKGLNEIYESSKAYQLIYPTIANALENGEKVFINIKD